MMDECLNDCMVHYSVHMVSMMIPAVRLSSDSNCSSIRHHSARTMAAVAVLRDGRVIGHVHALESFRFRKVSNVSQDWSRTIHTTNRHWWSSIQTATKCVMATRWSCCETRCLSSYVSSIWL